ncbi:MAG: hypothetical protein WBA89_14180, partial [Microcoleus sp.]|uniref:hypothetical protein n=1 Tax=Microcoleus sp. TaxID=44472 RepID=UPI003C77C5D0
VPQEKLIFVCFESRNRQDACSTRKINFCGTGILPVLENGAADDFKPPIPINNVANPDLVL